MAWLKTQVSFGRSQENRNNRWLQNEYLSQLSVNMKIQQGDVFVLVISEYNIKIHFIWKKGINFVSFHVHLQFLKNPGKQCRHWMLYEKLFWERPLSFNINRQSSKISFLYLFLQLRTSIWKLLCTNNLRRKPKKPHKVYLRFQRAFKSKLCDWN